MISLINSALGATINTNLPGPYSVATGGPVAIVANAYYLALALGGLLAFGSIVYAGIKWTASRGNTTAIGDAQDQITQAVIGLLILLGTYIILNTINPTLTLLQIPQLTEIKSEVAGAGALGNQVCSGKSQGTCPLLTGLECKNTGDAANPNWACKPKPDAFWVCRDSALTVKFCVRQVAGGPGGAGGSTCNSNCLATYSKNCTFDANPPSGGCAGLISGSTCGGAVYGSCPKPGQNCVDVDPSVGSFVCI